MNKPKIIIRFDVVMKTSNELIGMYIHILEQANYDRYDVKKEYKRYIVTGKLTPEQYNNIIQTHDVELLPVAYRYVI